MKRWLLFIFAPWLYTRRVLRDTKHRIQCLEAECRDRQERNIRLHESLRDRDFHIAELRKQLDYANSTIVRLRNLLAQSEAAREDGKNVTDGKGGFICKLQSKAVGGAVVTNAPGFGVLTRNPGAGADPYREIKNIDLDRPSTWGNK